jgi:hypothetical protein
MEAVLLFLFTKKKPFFIKIKMGMCYINEFRKKCVFLNNKFDRPYHLKKNQVSLAFSK